VTIIRGLKIFITGVSERDDKDHRVEKTFKDG
jgi:hypothetical protein